MASEGIGMVQIEAHLGLEEVPAELRQPPKFLRGGIAVAADSQTTGRRAEIPMFLPGDISGRDSRAALLAPSPHSWYRFVVEVPEGAELRTAAGYAIFPENIGRTVRFRVELTPQEPPSNPQVLIDQDITVREDGSWTPLGTDLSQWARQTVELRFSVDEMAADTAEGPRAPVWAGWATPEIVDAGGRQEGFDLLWISLDTLRADHLGTYGYTRRSTSPNLDRLAAAGVVFTTAVSQAPWTRPSHRAMFMGNYPLSNWGYESVPLARRLWHEGWRTGALTGGGQVDTRFGFHDGFDTYRVKYWHQDLDAVDRWYAANEGRRSFLFLHTFAIHDPYTDHRFARAESLPPGRIGEEFTHEQWKSWQRRVSEEERVYIEALYDGGIAAVDEALGELFRRLESSGRLDRTLVVVTADHGEQLFERGGWRHGSELYDDQILVPAILHLPPAMRDRLGDPPGRIGQQIQLIDLYPTVLELLDLEQDHKVQGHSLMPLLRGEALEPWLAFTENINIAPYERKAFRTKNWKLVWQTPRGAAGKADDEIISLYNLRKDPSERIDVSREHAEAVADYAQRMHLLVEGGSPPEEEVPDDLSPELLERLRALGYVK